MKALLDQLRELPSANLVAYLLGAFAVVATMLFLHGIKPGFLHSRELMVEYQQLERLTARFDLDTLRTTIAKSKEQQEIVRDSMLQNIPDRQLEDSLPTLLESLHQVAKDHGLRTQRLQPGEISRNSDIATVPVSLLVSGSYLAIYNWINDFAVQFEGVSVSDIQAKKTSGSTGFRTMAINLVIYGR